MLNTQGPLPDGGDKIQVFQPRKLGVDIVNDLMILLLVEADFTSFAIETDLSYTLQNVYPRLSLPRLLSLVELIPKGVPHLFYSLLTSMLSIETTLDFSYSPTLMVTVLCKGVSI